MTNMTPRQIARFAFLRAQGHTAIRAWWGSIGMIGGGR